VVIDARPGLDRTRLQEPARSLLARRARGDASVVVAQGNDPAAVETLSSALAVADAAARLAARIAADPGCAPDVAACGGVDPVADQLVPIVAWAVDLPKMTDLDAVRVGVIVARTRLLLGTPRRIVLPALHMVPDVLATESSSPGRLHELAIEVGLRLRRQRGLPEEISLA
jgi:hypothetical protein